MYLLELKNITKRFPGNVLALDDVNFDLKSGEVHALLGENGAGKTTLMNIVFGLYRHDHGEIFVEGKKVNITSPASAIEHGIGMVQQHFTLVPSFSVAENIALGMKKSGHFRVNLKKVIRKIKELSDLYNMNIDPNAKIWQLSVSEKQKVEILKVLYEEAKIIIFDEPTAVLTPQESESLFKAIELMKENGKGIIFISHKLKEVVKISDRVTVLKNGKIIGTLNKEEFNENRLARMMVGKDFTFNIQKADNIPGKEILNIENLEVRNDKGILAVKGLNLIIKEGEILGIAGVAGNGQRELAESIVGLRKVEKGKIKFCGFDITNASVRKRLSLGIAYVPQDRKETATCPNLSVVENLFIRQKNKSRILNQKKMLKNSRELIKKYSIVTRSEEQPIKFLSGGNMQKVVLAREFELSPKLIIVEHPTRGLDVKAMEFVYNSLIKARNKGVAILLIAGDLDEVFAISDRVAIIFEGKIMGYVEPEESKVNELGLMMAGVAVEA
ncbi:MAG: ral nucleoside transport system ATP-binding protein [Thermotogaceae bacterium]|nr:ral nucleoside transport system ATP-binding protein [Thermotogaceae bacterium]MDN5337257.1 ral nucleoside transport system ATP-binding protein [Thermotogaceae bacterium]